MMKMQLLTATALSAGLLMVGPAQAAITFVDATPDTGPGTGNTTLNGDEIVFSGPGQNSTTTDNPGNGLWDYRTQADANGGAFFTLTDGEYGDGTIGTAGINGVDTPNDEDDIVPLIFTTDLADGLYDIYGLFYNGTSTQSFTTSFSVGDAASFEAFTGMNAGTSSGNTSSATRAPTVDAADYTTPISTSILNGAATLREAYLGQFAVTGGELTVFISSQNELVKPSTASGVVGDERAWFEGIGFEVVPEPSSLALLGLGGLAMLSRRRQA